MRVPLNWIKEYTVIKIDHKDLVEKVFTQIGAVEGEEDWNKKYDGIITAEIVDKQEHPNAEKLAVYKINIGKDEEVQIVAGDKTLEIGDKVAYFKPGTKVPYNAHPEKYDGIVSKVSLRGINSEGMLASEKELDLGPDHSQVMRLDKDTKSGQNFADLFGLNDIILDVENKALANRADLFGIIGLAREMSGIQGLAFHTPEWLKKPVKPEGENQTQISVTNNAQTYCKRYMAVVMDNITIKPSPVWMKSLLIKAGMRPINNVVDITNYMMYLTAQPLHAFDLDKLLTKSQRDNPAILVRLAENGEMITTLDGKTVSMDDNTMVITDGKDPVAIAGVMGGIDTEVDENTKRILIEAANFDRYNIRKTSMRLGYFTEAVTRYTKALDPNFCEPVLYKTVELMKELAEGKQISPIVDNYLEPIKEKIITINVDDLNIHLGLQLSKEEIQTVLTNLEYEVSDEPNGEIQLVVPTFRQDVTIKQDVFEDVGRHYGYNNIKVTLPTRSILPSEINPMLEFKEKVRNIMTSLGGNEILTYNFMDAKFLAQLSIKIDKAYKLINALSPELEYMRYSVLPSVIEKTLANFRQGYDKFILYEINKGHSKDELDKDGLPLEREYLASVTMNPEYTGSSYYSSKALLDQLLKELNIKTYKLDLLKGVDTINLPAWIARYIEMLNENKSAVLMVNEEYVGIVGELKKGIAERLELPSYLSVFEVDITTLIKYSSHGFGYIEPSRYPKSTQDFCVEVDSNIKYERIEELFNKTLTDVDYIYKLIPLDIYQKDVNDATKKVTIRVEVQNRDRTLQQYDLSQIRNSIKDAVEKELKGKIV